MNHLLLFFLLLTSATAFAQTDKAALVAESKRMQEELNADYRDKEKSPLKPEDLEKFKGHDFFPVSADYIIEAELELTENEPVFNMPTTTARLAEYRKYGYVVFAFQGETHRLAIYQSPGLMQKPEYADYLFLPFTDQTTGKQTYSGGRYLEARIPKPGTKILLDFNRAYNPYCAYNPRYSCPKVPIGNHLEMEVRAGVKLKK